MPNSTNVPSSTSSARRSRAVSLSCSCWRAIFSSPPPRRARSRRSWRSSTSDRSEGRATRLSAAARSVAISSRKRYFLLLRIGRDPVKQRVEHPHRRLGGVGQLVGVGRSLERRHLDPHQLRVVRDGLHQVVELV